MGQTLMTEILGILFSGLTETATSMGQAIVNMVKAVFLQTTEGVTSLNVFGILIVIFAGISLALSLFRLVLSGVMLFVIGNSDNDRSPQVERLVDNGVICWNTLRAFSTISVIV